MDVRTLCLGALTQGPMSGYEIKKLFEGAFRHFFVAGYGSIYPALAELAREALVTVTDVAQTGRPAKKVYRITPQGRRRLREALLSTPPRHKIRSEFLALLYFAELLPRAHLGRLVDERAREIDALLGHIHEVLAVPGLPAAQALVGELGAASLEAQRRFLAERRDELLACAEPDEGSPRPDVAEGAS